MKEFLTNNPITSMDASTCYIHDTQLKNYYL